MARCSPYSTDPYRPLTAEELANSLARRLIPVADTMRAIGVRLGTRPYEVRIVRTAWTGEYRGDGMEYVVEEHQITPTPLVEGIDGLLQSTEGVGQVEQGTVAVSEISGRYTEDFLRGFGQDGAQAGPNEQVFYEIRLPTIDGDGIRRRFYLRNGPSYVSEDAQWKMTLERQVEDRPPERY